MKNSKNSQKMYKIAEKIALDDFDTQDEQHEFSDTYKHKKKLFMEEIKMKGEQPKVKRRKNRIAIAAACLLIGLPTTTLGAVKVYDMIAQKQNYEVDISVTNANRNNSDKSYKLIVDYLPENMEANDDTNMKYSFKDNYANGGFSFILWRLGESSDFQTLYSKNYEEKEINGRKVIIVNKDTGNEHTKFDRQFFLLFEKEGFMLESYVGNDVNEEQMMKVIENISLEPSSKEEASYTVNFEESKINDTTEQTEFTVIPLEKDSNRLFSVGEVLPVTIEEHVNGKKTDNLEYVINKVEVFDSIKDFKQENFNKLGLDTLNENNALDQTMKLLPYKRNVYKVGDGINSIDELVKSQSVNLKFVYLETTVKNIGKQSTEEIYMHPSLQVLKSENNAWNYASEDGISEHSMMSGEVDYLEPHGNGKSFYNIGSIQPGETKKVNLGYFVDEDKLNSMFLDAFHYTGSGETENLNAKDRWWIDIRQ